MATETSKLEIVKEIKCSPHKFYEMIKYTLHHLPTVCPELVPGADIIEGDGESVGTVRLWKYVIPGTTEILEAKEKTELIDDENMLIVLDICEGDHTDHYARFVEKIQVIPKGEASLVKWTLEYEKAKEGASDPHLYMDLFAKITDKLEAHLTKMATETSKLEIAKEVKCSPHKFYEMIKYTLHHLPTVCPELVPSADIIEGDGESVGTVRLWKYVIPGTSQVLEAKEKTEVIDDENMLIVLDICEGDHTDHYARVVEKIQVIPKGEGSLVKWTLEYEKAKEGVSDPHHYMDLFAKITDKLEAHLIAKA